MVSTLSAVTASLHPVVGSNIILYEIPIIVVVVILLVVVLIMNTRKKKGPKQPAEKPAPQAYYADLQQPAGQQQMMAQPQMAAQPGYAPAPQGAPGAPMAPASPPPGTPAGWLPDPGGAPNTLRYWDGNAWTQHVAARS